MFLEKLLDFAFVGQLQAMVVKSLITRASFEKKVQQLECQQKF